MGNAIQRKEIPVSAGTKGLGQSEVFDAKGISNYFGISLPSAYELMRSEGFPAFRISPRRIVAPREAVIQWAKDQATKGGV